MTGPVVAVQLFDRFSHARCNSGEPPGRDRVPAKDRCMLDARFTLRADKTPRHVCQVHLFPTLMRLLEAPGDD